MEAAVRSGDICGGEAVDAFQTCSVQKNEQACDSFGQLGFGAVGGQQLVNLGMLHVLRVHKGRLRSFRSDDEELIGDTTGVEPSDEGGGSGCPASVTCDPFIKGGLAEICDGLALVVKVTQ
ncbi:hypothetical protein [Microbacterium sp. GXF6406]